MALFPCYKWEDEKRNRKCVENEREHFTQAVKAPDTRPLCREDPWAQQAAYVAQT